MWKTNNSINDSKWKKKEGFHYLTVKKFSKLLRGIASKHHHDLYCLNSLYSFKTEKTLKFYEKVCKNIDFCGAVIPSGKKEILGFNKNLQQQK